MLQCFWQGKEQNEGKGRKRGEKEVGGYATGMVGMEGVSMQRFPGGRGCPDVVIREREKKTGEGWRVVSTKKEGKKILRVESCKRFCKSGVKILRCLLLSCCARLVRLCVRKSESCCVVDFSLSSTPTHLYAPAASPLSVSAFLPHTSSRRLPSASLQSPSPLRGDRHPAPSAAPHISGSLC